MARRRILQNRGAHTAQVTQTERQTRFQASGRLELDQDRVLDLRELFAPLDKQPDSRFLKLEDGEFIALTASFRRQLDDLRSLSAPSAQGSVRFHAMTAPALQNLF